MQNHRNSLQPGYRLHWYVIKKILGQGGFGITYLAEDTNLNQEVAIKEYLPVELAVREQDDSIHPVSGEYGEQFSWGLDRFMSEAQTLAKFKHPNIVRVLAVFPENNTAYMVMEYEKGQAMHELLKEKKTLSENQLGGIILPILGGLEQVHMAGFIHRDIKPPNIFIRADGTPVLLDFGSARQALGERTRTLTSMISPGFAPFEQYVSRSDKQGPWTDIYGLAATLYRSVVGRSPAEAMDRSESLLHTNRDAFVGAAEINPAGYSRAFLMAIDHGLAFKADERPQTIAQWRAELQGTVAEPHVGEAETMQASVVNTLAEENPTRQEPTKITIKADAGPVSDNEPGPVKAKAWYRKPLKVIAVAFGVFLLLAILNEEDKKKKAQEVAGNEAGEAMQMDAAETSTDTIDRLLTAADEDIRALRLSSPDGNNAVEKYREVLEQDAENPQALAGLREVAEEYLELARNSMADDDLGRAGFYLDKARSLNSQDPDIADLEQAIAARSGNLSRSDSPAQESSATREEDVISSSDRRKLARVKRQLTRNPDSKPAREELRKLSNKYEALVKKAFKEKNYALAQSYLDAMLNLAPDNRKLQELQATIKEKLSAD